MNGFEFNELDLAGAYYISNFSVGDDRGRFTKCFEKEIYAKAGINFKTNEIFVSVSVKNVIRGLHFQLHNPQAKLVCALQGSVWDVMIDLRTGSPTYKKWTGAVLCPDRHNALYIPRGFAHGFASLEDGSVLLYQCDGAYDKETDTGIRFDDPEIGVEWPIDVKEAIHSERDLQLMSLADYEREPMILTTIR